MAQPTEDMLRAAVGEALVCAESEGHTEAKANTDYCVQFLMDRFPDLGRAGALSAFMRLCFQTLSDGPEDDAGAPLPASPAPQAEKPARPAKTRRRRSARNGTRLPLGPRGEPLPVWQQPLHALALNRRGKRRSR